ncbi:MAG: plasmid stabilization protein [Rhodospirillaceae bacterium]|nr:plasmid stabilization protein [Rhodospirillaceae bacterium]
MGRIVRRPAARADLEAIWSYIAADDPERATAFLRALERRTLVLAENPRLGPARFPNFPGLRCFSAEGYLIIYRPLPEETGIELVRLIHGARDLEALLSEMD